MVQLLHPYTVSLRICRCLEHHLHFRLAPTIRTSRWFWSGCGTQLCLFLRENWPINSFETSTLESRSVFLGHTEDSLYTMKALVMQSLITTKMYFHYHLFAGLPTGVLALNWLLRSTPSPPWSDDSFPQGEAARPQNAHLVVPSPVGFELVDIRWIWKIHIIYYTFQFLHNMNSFNYLKINKNELMQLYFVRNW